MAKKILKNQDLGVSPKSNRLGGLKVGLAICGGIAATETVKLARELRRHGADVTAYLSPSATDFVTPTALEWACGRPVILKATSLVEHLEAHDLVIVAPATLNSIAKAAAAICDNVVTLLIASQLGRKAPLVFVPTMNEVLADHPLLPELKKRLESWGALFSKPLLEEGRWKMPSPPELVEQLLKLIKK